MAVMTIVEVCKILYPDQVEQRNIMFGMNEENHIFVNYWAVKDIPQPTDDYLESQIAIYEPDWLLNNFIFTAVFSLNNLTDYVALERGYNCALLCLSYVESSNVAWQSDAIELSAWRDSIFKYFVAQVQLMRAGSRTVPGWDVFKSELPAIQWPSTTNFPESQPL